MYNILIKDIITYGLVFCRVGAILMLMPGFSHATIPPRIRIWLGLTITALITPVVAPILPTFETLTPLCLQMILQEIMIGIFLGSCLSLILYALDMAGALIAQQMGHSNAAILNPILATQSFLSSTLLILAGITLLFITDLHHLLLGALVQSYHKLPGFEFMWTGDWTRFFIRCLQQGLVVAVQISAPLMICITILFVGLGILNRLIPVVHTFFIAQPIQIGLGLALFAFTVISGLRLFLDFMGQMLNTLGFGHG